MGHLGHWLVVTIETFQDALQKYECCAESEI